jgi:hypothetical protein
VAKTAVLRADSPLVSMLRAGASGASLIKTLGMLGLARSVGMPAMWQAEKRLSVSVENAPFETHLSDSREDFLASPLDLNACLNSHGLYDPLRFVLRLSPEVHRKIEVLQAEFAAGKVSFDGLRAFSTYVHETIHWWQHAGSTIGLMLSLSYPAQAHTNHGYLKEFLARVGAKKSIRQFIEMLQGPGGDPDTPAGLGSVIVNNHFDIEFFRRLVFKPEFARDANNHPYFECVGHSFQIAYGNVGLILATALDPEFLVLPNAKSWSPAFAAMRSEKRKGYYWGSPINIFPVGAHQIFEGQARFGQLQYLYFASGGKLSWDDFRSLGMLQGVYSEAFEQFLHYAELEWPSSIDHPVVALFLLVCDIAINPGAGFPMPLRSFNSFIEDVDPGIRFLFLCWTIAKQRPDLAGAIRSYSRTEYGEVAEALTKPILVDHPLVIAAEVGGWTRKSERLKALMEEHRTANYGPVNLPVHLMFAHYLAFCADKFVCPEFFCWPGAWMTGERLSKDIEALFVRNESPFMDKADDGGIYPRLVPGKDENAVHETFENFYAVNVTYDLTRQWITQRGPFSYDYRWLSSTGAEADMKKFAARHFEKIYGIDPDTIEIL